MATATMPSLIRIIGQIAGGRLEQAHRFRGIFAVRIQLNAAQCRSHIGQSRGSRAATQTGHDPRLLQGDPCLLRFRLARKGRDMDQRICHRLSGKKGVAGKPQTGSQPD